MELSQRKEKKCLPPSQESTALCSVNLCHWVFILLPWADLLPLSCLSHQNKAWDMPSLSLRTCAGATLCAPHSGAQFTEINPGLAFTSTAVWYWQVKSEILRWRHCSPSCTLSCDFILVLWQLLLFCSQSSLTLATCLLFLLFNSVFYLNPATLSLPPVVTVLIRWCSWRSDFTTAFSTIASLFSASLFASPLPLFVWVPLRRDCYDAVLQEGRPNGATAFIILHLNSYPRCCPPVHNVQRVFDHLGSLRVLFWSRVCHAPKHTL